MDRKTKNREDWFVVVNPHAGTNKCSRDWPGIKKLLEQKNFQMKIIFTERQFHAIELVKTAIEKERYTNILVVGGDGTLNEAVNGIFKQQRFRTDEITLGLVTVGTGNDWGRMYEMPESYKKQIKLLRKGYTFLQDVGEVEYRYAIDEEKRYFVNIAGMGYDALVAQKTNLMKQKGRGGVLAYLINLVTGLFQYQNTHLDIMADGKQIFSGNVFSMSIGICKYNGGGMMQLPDAIPDDGLFDITVIRKTTKFRIVSNIKNLFDGSFVKMPEVEQYRGKMISIKSKPPQKLYLETDGESLGHSPLDFKVIPKAIRLIVRKRYSVNE